MTAGVAAIQSLTILRWEAPPPTNYGRHRRGAGTARREQDPWLPVAEELRHNAGVWAVIAESETHGSVTNLATQVNGGRSPAWSPRGHFEATSRRGDRLMTVYARYVGLGGGAS